MIKDLSYLDLPYQKCDNTSHCVYHGTTVREIENAMGDPNARVILPFDSQDDIVVKIGDIVTTKYARIEKIIGFEGDYLVFESGEKLTEDRIAYKVSDERSDFNNRGG